MNLKKLKKTFIVAEIGNNHEGSFNLACKLINEAKKSGVDAVKFQTFKTENFINFSEKKRFKKLKKFELSYENFYKLSIIAKKKGLKFISTPLDIPSAIFLNKIVNCFKISSGDNNYYELIKTVLNFNKPTFISTGLLNFSEIKNLLNFIRQNRFDLSKLSFLHCVSDYPVAFDQANVSSVEFLRKNLPLTIGYSDHTIGKEAPLIAVSLGAKIIEKHFTLDRTLPGPDHAASLEPDELKAMVKSVRNIELAISGSGIKKPSESEIKNITIARKSIHLNKNLSKGHIICEEDIIALRPGDGISPMEWNTIIGKKLKEEKKRFDKLFYSDFI